MTDHRAVVRAAIAHVAPDVDLDELGDDAEFGEGAGLDSMDFLNVLAAIAESTGVEVPERDYPRVTTISSLAGYLDDHTR